MGKLQAAPPPLPFMVADRASEPVAAYAQVYRGKDALAIFSGTVIYLRAAFFRVRTSERDNGGSLFRRGVRAVVSALLFKA